ncbi:MAG: 2-C-methyl-D-erythritol 2,4-cyclodiphosphate synthase [Eubacterium sp.]|nr:2-C-methyl-D-erythritol 2,4-cyclodiphosphate synthase [Eubacterium sp.]
MTGQKDTAAIIVAGGGSTRMCGMDKQTALLCGKPVVSYSIAEFDEVDCISEIVVVASENNIEEIRRIVARKKIKKPTIVILGGDTRVKSVINGINAIKSESRLVAVHDGARPLIRKEDIEGVILLARKWGAAILASSMKDTVKVFKSNEFLETPDRSRLFIASTPQVFALDTYKKLIAKGIGGGFSDDASVFEAENIKVKIYEGMRNNLKITTREDLSVARAILEDRTEKQTGGYVRVGIGYDVHRFSPDRKLVLGGVDIPNAKGLLGHSDADVLAHAIMDSLLGALALGDIGRLFPDSENKYKGADSFKLLEEVMALINERDFFVGNIDCVIIAEEPKVSPFIESMRTNISKICQTDIKHVSVKATTEEGLGLAGKGIGAKVLCLLKKF